MPSFLEQIQYLQNQYESSRRAASFGAAGSASYGYGMSDQTRITGGPGTSFFGSFGPLAAMATGLVAPGPGGAPTPVFTSDLGFGGMDPSLTLSQMATSQRNSQLMGAISSPSATVFSGMGQSLFSPDSLFGQLAYRKDASGNYVNPSLAAFAGGAQEFMGTPYGNAIAGMVLPQLLGYNPAAGAGVVQGRIAGVVAGLGSRGLGGFGPSSAGVGGFDEESLLREQTAIGSGLEGTRRRFMYDRYGLRRRENSYSLGDEAVASIMSDMLQGGAFDDLSFGGMSEEDSAAMGRARAARDRAGSMRAQIRKYEREISALEAIPNRDKAQEDRLKALRSSVDRWGKQIDEVNAEADRELESVSTYSGGSESVTDAYRRMQSLRGDIESLSKERESISADMARASASGDEDRLKELSAKLREKEAQLQSKQDEIGLIDRSVEKITEERTRSVTRLVESIKDLVGSDENAMQAVKQLTGGAYAGPDSQNAANTIAAQLAHIKTVGRQGGLSNQAMGMMLSEASGSIGESFAGESYGRGFGQSAASGALAMGRFQREVNATVGRTGIDAQQAHAAQRWRENDLQNSTMYRTAQLLEYSRQNGDLDDSEYSRIRGLLESGNRDTMTKGMEDLLRRRFGSVANGMEFLNNNAYMERVQSSLTTESGVNATNILNTSMTREDRGDMATMGNLGVWRRYSSALEDAGADSQYVEDEATSEEFNAVARVLGGEHGDPRASALLNARYRAALENNGGDVNAAKAEALSYFNSNIKKNLSGELSAEVDRTGTRARATVAKLEFDKLKDSGADVAGRALEIMEDMASGDQVEKVSKLRVEYDEAVSRGDYRAAAAVGERARKLFGGEAGKAIWDQAVVDASGITGGSQDMLQDAATFLGGLGKDVTPESLRFYQDFQNAKGGKFQEILDPDKLLADFDKGVAGAGTSGKDLLAKALTMDTSTQAGKDEAWSNFFKAFKNQGMSDEEYWKFLGSGIPLQAVKEKIGQIDPTFLESHDDDFIMEAIRSGARHDKVDLKKEDAVATPKAEETPAAGADGGASTTGAATTVGFDDESKNALKEAADSVKEAAKAIRESSDNINQAAEKFKESNPPKMEQ